VEVARANASGRRRAIDYSAINTETRPSGRWPASKSDPEPKGSTETAKDKNDKKRKMNPRSLSNLKPPFQAGEVHNPEGINKKWPITDEYFGTSREPLPEKLCKKINKLAGEEVLRVGATWAKGNSIRRFLDALDAGGQTSSREIRESIEGRAPERLEISGPERKEIKIRLIHSDRKRQ
jgi:hypothetical protein